MDWWSLLSACDCIGIAINGGYNSLAAAVIALVLGFVGKTNPRGTAKGRQTPTWRAAMLAYKTDITEVLQVKNKPTSWGRGKRVFAQVGSWIMADAVENQNTVTLTRANMIAGILAALLVIGTPVVTSFSYVLNLKFSVDSLKQTQDAQQRTIDNQQKLLEKLADSDIERRTQNATLEAKLDQVLGRLK